MVGTGNKGRGKGETGIEIAVPEALMDAPHSNDIVDGDGRDVTGANVNVLGANGAIVNNQDEPDLQMDDE